MRVAPQIVLDDDERKILQRGSRGRSTPARLVLRAKIVLLAAQGKQKIYEACCRVHVRVVIIQCLLRTRPPTIGA